MKAKDLKSFSVLSMYENRAISKYKRGEVSGPVEERQAAFKKKKKHAKEIEVKI